MEGDLIECLNAGDGSWWTGRLRRDRRMVGLFPSNFVELLGDDFVPGSRSVSPMPPGDTSRISSSAPKKQKTVFRKPFQGYKEFVGPSELLKQKTEAAASQVQLQHSPSISRTSGSRSGTRKREKSISRAPSRLPNRHQSRAVSPIPPPAAIEYRPPRAVSPNPPPAPTHYRPLSRAVSPIPPPAAIQYGSRSRAISPIPPPAAIQYRPPSRAISPMPPPAAIQYRPSSRAISPIPSPAASREASPPPPPPPPHRIAVRSLQAPRHTPSPIPDSHRPNHVLPRTPSPHPPSPSYLAHTPSPLRDAMEDVMSSLQDMGVRRDASSPQPYPAAAPFTPWSPDGYDQYLNNDRPERSNRPLTSLGLSGGSLVEDDREYEHQHNYPDHYHDGPPQLNNYVQRMESRLRQMHEPETRNSPELHFPPDDAIPPAPPPKRPQHRYNQSIPQHQPSLRKRKSAYELSGDLLGRTFTTKSSATNSSSGTQSTTTNSTSSTGMTSQSMMSGASAGGFSATSAGSLARRAKANSISTARPNTALENMYSRDSGDYGRAYQDPRPHTPMGGATYHSGRDSPRQGATSATGFVDFNRSVDSSGVFGGLTTPKSKKTGFLKKILESAKTSAATARSSIAATQRSQSASPSKGIASASIPSASPPKHGHNSDREMGIGGNDWVQVRRDVNRATSPSQNELVERAERCQMMDHAVIYAVEELHESAEGDEGIDGLPIAHPTNWDVTSLQLVDRSARFINSLPPMANPISLAQGYVCRPHRSDGQRLRAIFTWVAEKIAWDDGIEDAEIDLRKVIQLRRGCSREVASLVLEMGSAVGLHVEMIQGYLKTPGEQVDVDCLSRPNHWWNAVLIDGEWRVMDCSLASPTHPRRALYSSTNPHAAECWYFLTRPMEICYTHIPVHAEHQHICPPISPDVLLSLPSTCPSFFKNGLRIPKYDTSLVQTNALEVVHIRVHVPPDVECVAEVETIAVARDADGDFYESGDIIRKRALAQPDWLQGQKRFTIKALLPGDEGQGILKVYAGKKGLMHSSKDITHPLAFALPIIHTGENPPYEFFVRHPTPHAQRHDLYIVQPQCSSLAINNTYVFAIRQHPSYPPSVSSSFNAYETGGRISPNPYARPASSLSMVSSIAGASTVSGASSTPSLVSAKQSSSGQREKPAKLAIQTPSGKILRLTRKADHMITTSTNSDSENDGTPDGSMWETVIKVGERGVWRGLVLADRSARWCVWGEWECQ